MYTHATCYAHATHLPRPRARALRPLPSRTPSVAEGVLFLHPQPVSKAVTPNLKLCAFCWRRKAMLTLPPPISPRVHTPRSPRPPSFRLTPNELQLDTMQRPRTGTLSPIAATSRPATTSAIAALAWAAWPVMPPERVFSPPVSPRRGDSNDPTSIERAVGACADGDLDGLLDWLSSGGDVNGSAFGLTLLCAAAENGRLRAVEMLLQRHAIVDACAPDDELSRTALIRACEQRHATCVRSLLDAKASLSHRSGEGFTALDVLRETTKREVLHGLDFVRLMDCTRAITVRMQKDEAMYYDGASVPTPATVVTAEEDRLLDSWAKRVEKEEPKVRPRFKWDGSFYAKRVLR